MILIPAVWLGMILLWVALPPGSAARIGSSPLFPFVLASLALLPVYPLYRLAKAWPRLFWGILVLGICLLLTLNIIILQYAFHIDNAWVNRMLDLSQVLCVVSSLLFIWQGVRKRS
jgi:membrane protein YdbS with pleckstrin-like domain